MEQSWQQHEPMDVDMRELLLVLWRKAWLIILAAALAAGAAYGGTKLWVTPQYQASVLFYVNNASMSADGLISSLVKEELDVAKQMVDTYAVILNTRKTLDDVLAAAEMDMAAEELQDSIEIAELLVTERVNETELFRVYITWNDPVEAERLANAIAEVLPVRIAEIIDDTSARIVDGAVLPTEPAAPSARNSFLLGGMLGVVMSAGYLALRYLFDEKIRSVSDLSRYSSLPVLAVVPELGHDKHERA